MLGKNFFEKPTQKYSAYSVSQTWKPRFKSLSSFCNGSVHNGGQIS